MFSSNSLTNAANADPSRNSLPSTSTNRRLSPNRAPSASAVQPAVGRAAPSAVQPAVNRAAPSARNVRRYPHMATAPPHQSAPRANAPRQLTPDPRVTIPRISGLRAAASSLNRAPSASSISPQFTVTLPVQSAVGRAAPSAVQPAVGRAAPSAVQPAVGRAAPSARIVRSYPHMAIAPPRQSAPREIAPRPLTPHLRATPPLISGLRPAATNVRPARVTLCPHSLVSQAKSQPKSGPKENKEACKRVSSLGCGAEAKLVAKKVNYGLPCSLCFDDLFKKNVSITQCGHIYCVDCVAKMVKNELKHCPLCNVEMNTSKIHRAYLPELQECD